MHQRAALRALPRPRQGLDQTQQASVRATQTQHQTLTQDQQQSLKYLALAGLRLERELAQALDENPFLTVTNTHSAQEAGDWLTQIAAPGPETLSAALRVLAQDLFWQAEDRLAAAYLIDAVADSGLLCTPLADLDLPFSLDQARRVQAAFLAESPGGLLADDLAQCFGAQLRIRGELTQANAAVLALLPLIAERGARVAAQESGLPIATVLSCLDKIRTLNPRPAQALDYERPCLRPPDLILQADAATGGWRARLNPLLNRTYGLDEEALSGLSPQALKSASIAPLIAEARSFVRALTARGKTLTILTAHLAGVQDRALRQGLAHIQPYSQGQAADALGLHASTISRAVADKTVGTPQGLIPLKAFFSTLIDPKTQFSAAQMRAQLSALIAAEDRTKPLSDEALAQAILATGTQVARRTVTKYRLALKVPSASQRKHALPPLN